MCFLVVSQSTIPVFTLDVCKFKKTTISLPSSASTTNKGELSDC